MINNQEKEREPEKENKKLVSKIDHTFTFIMDSTKFLQSKQTCTFRRGCRFTSQATLSQAVQRKLLFCFSGKLELIISSSTFFTLNWSTILCTLDLGELRRTSLSTSRSPSQSECLESLESVKLFKARKTIDLQWLQINTTIRATGTNIYI